MSSSPPLVVADRYRLVAPLGQGGMGRVWRATDVVLHRDVAIKELVPPPGLTPGERQEMRERSLREARAIARLNNVNVVRVFDVLRTDADPWIVMEYVESRSLHDTLASDGPFHPVRAAEIGLGVLGALRAAHRAGVVHRDVKPGNVLMGADGRVVLTDFGLATVPGDPNVTRTGLVLGSPAYIAPERARDGTAGPAADLWSLGATLYAAVEGASPFARPSAIATLAALATENPPPSRNAGPLKPVLNGLLRKDPTHRINAEEAERLLLRALGRRSKLTFPMSPTMRRPGVGRERPALPPTGATPVVPGPRPPVAPSRPVNAPGQAPVSGGRAVDSDGRPPVFVPGKAPVGRPSDQPTRVDAPKVDAPRLDPTRVDGPPVREDQPPSGTRPSRSPSSRPSPGPASHEMDPALARTVRGGGPGGFTAADVTAARRKKAAPEHERSLAEAAAAMGSGADATTVVPPAADQARPGRQQPAPMDATTVVPPPTTKGRRVLGADATTVVPSPARPKSPDATTVVPRPTLEAPAADATTVVPRPTVEAPAADATTVVPRPTVQAPAADATTVVPRPTVQAPTADATTVVPSPAKPKSPDVTPPGKPTVVDAGTVVPQSATATESAVTAPEPAAESSVAEAPPAADNKPAATKPSPLTKRQRRDRAKAAPAVDAPPAEEANGSATATDEKAAETANDPTADEVKAEGPDGESTPDTPAKGEAEADQAESQSSQHESGQPENGRDAINQAEVSAAEAVDPVGAKEAGAVEAGAKDGGAKDGGAKDGGANDGGANDGGANDDGANDDGANDDGAVENGAAENGAKDDGPVGNGAVGNGANEEGSVGDGSAGAAPNVDEKVDDPVRVALPPVPKRKSKTNPAGGDAAPEMPSDLPPFSPAARPPWKPMQVSPPARKAGITVFGTRLTYRQAVIGAAALLVVVLLVIVLAVKAFGGGGDHTPAATPTAKTTGAKGGKAPVGAAPSAGTTTSASVAPSAAPSSAPATTSRPPSPAATGGSIVLPAGWKWYSRPTQGSYPGFTIPIPQNTSVSPEGSQIYLRWNNRLLIVDRTNAPQADPVQDWKNQEANRTYRDYHKIKLVAVNYFKAGADWEFTYTTDKGNAQHADKRNVVVSSSAAYSLNWYTTPEDWAAAQSDLQVIYRGFQPKP